MASDNRTKDVKETEGGSRWLTILDSWLPTDDITEVDAFLGELSLDDEGDDQKRRHGLILSHRYTYLRPGSIDIAWDDACTLFGSVCISWNPVMFKNRLIYHGSVLATLSAAFLPNTINLEFGEPLIYHQQDEMNVCCPIQTSAKWSDFLEAVHQTLRLRLERPQDAQRPLEKVWILLTRHRIDTRRSSEYISLHAEYNDDHPNTTKNITDFAKTQGIYTDNPHVLVRTSTSSKSTFY